MEPINLFQSKINSKFTELKRFPKLPVNIICLNSSVFLSAYCSIVQLEIGIALRPFL